MILILKKIIFIFITAKFNSKKSLSFIDLNFRQIDFTNHSKIKSFIFQKNFYKHKNKYVQNFDFLNFSNKLGGKIGINLSKEAIFGWYKLNKNKIGFPWIDDLPSKRLINLLYNYEYIYSSSKENDKKRLNFIIYFHIQRILFDFNTRKIKDLTSFDLIAYLLSCSLLKKINNKKIDYIKFIVENQIDKIGVHKSYNLLEHSKYINNLNEIKNILLFFKSNKSNVFDEIILKMTSILKEYFHIDGSIPLFNGANNIYTTSIYNSLSKNSYLKKREFSNVNNGIAFYSDKYKKIFFDVVQPN